MSFPDPYQNLSYKVYIKRPDNSIYWIVSPSASKIEAQRCAMQDIKARRMKGKSKIIKFQEFVGDFYGYGPLVGEL